MILIKKIISVQGKEVLLDYYLGDNYSVTLINKKQKTLFLKDMAQSFIVDEQGQTLHMMLSGKEQMDHIKRLLGEVWLDEAYHISTTYKQRAYHIANNFIAASAKLSGEVAVCEDSRLISTVNQTQNIFEARQHFFELPLKENELLSYVKTVIEIQGQTLTSIMEVLSIEEVIIPEVFKCFLEYTISTKAA